MMKGPKLLLGIPVLAILAFSGGCGNPEKQTDGPSTSGLATVRAVPAERMTLHPRIDLVGTLSTVPENTVVLSTQVDGLIDRLCVEEGQGIHEGDNLVILDDRSARVALDKASAALAEASSALALLEKGAHPRTIEAARQDVLKANATAHSLQKKLDALTPLYKNHEISDVRYEQANAELSAAQAEKEAAEARLKLLQDGARFEEIAEANAKVASAQAEEEAKQLVVDLCTIKSPIDGIITQLPVRQGMYVTPPATLVTIVDLSTLFAQIRIPAVYLSQVHSGAEATIDVPSLPDRQFSGAIARIGKEADPLTGDVTAFVSVPNPNGNLRPGLACRVRVSLPDVPNVTAVPVAAIADDGGTPVLTIIRDNKAYETEVCVGTQTSDFVQIVEGVQPEDLVAVEGGYGLPTGCPVRLAQDDQQAAGPALTPDSK